MKESLDKLSKEQLIDLLVSLASKNEENSNIINEKINEHNHTLKTVMKTNKKKDKPIKAFDISKYRQRNIAIQLQYEGGDYYGFASQTGECDNTIEKHVFEALLKLKLIDSREV